MGVRITGATGLASRLENTGKRSSEAALRALREGAEDIRDLARQMAPRKKGDLERDIDMKENRDGINGRVTIDVGVPYGASSAKYAFFVHEGIRFDDDPLKQPGSIAKQAANPAVRVGAYFLDRAVDELEEPIREKIDQAVRRAIGK